MALSASYDFSVARNDIIKSAMRKCGSLDAGLEPSAEELADFGFELNVLVASLQASHVFLWSLDWKTKTLTASSEVTGTDSNIYSCIKPHTAAATNKPITGEEWSTYWSLAGTTGGTWTLGNAYTAINEMSLDTSILDIQTAFLRDTTNQDTLLARMSLPDYMSIGSKGDSSSPTHFVFVPGPTPKIILADIPDDSTDVLHYLAVVKLDDFDESDNNPRLQQKYYDLLIWGLASRIMHELPVSATDKQFIHAQFNVELMRARRTDKDVSEDCFIEGAY